MMRENIQKAQSVSIEHDHHDMSVEQHDSTITMMMLFFDNTVYIPTTQEKGAAADLLSQCRRRTWRPLSDIMAGDSYSRYGPNAPDNVLLPPLLLL